MGWKGLEGRERREGLERREWGLLNRGDMPLRHETLVVWQRADDMFLSVHAISRRFPAYERFELGSQVRRAAYSVVANIVEGVNRRSPRETRHFLHIAEASLAEVNYCIHAAHRLGYLSDARRDELHQQLRMVGGPLVGLIRSKSHDE